MKGKKRLEMTCPYCGGKDFEQIIVTTRGSRPFWRKIHIIGLLSALSQSQLEHHHCLNCGLVLTFTK